MTLTYGPPPDPATDVVIDLLGDELIDLPADELLDLTDRRRVLLHTVLGLDVDPQTADAVFGGDGRASLPPPSPSPGT